MSPELRAALREVEQQRNDLLSGLTIAAAFERMGSRAAEAVFAAKVAEAKAASLEAENKKLKEPKPAKKKAAPKPPEPPAGG